MCVRLSFSDFVSSDASADVGRLLLQAEHGRSLVLVRIIFLEIDPILSPGLLSIVFYLCFHLSRIFYQSGFDMGCANSGTPMVVARALILY